MSDVSRDAQRIYQYLLDEIGDAISQRNFKKYRDFFQLPHRLETFEATVIIESVADLKKMYDTTCQRLESGGIKELTRNCTIASLDTPDTIIGSHETRLIDGSNRIQESYTALSTLRFESGVWRVADSQYAESDPSLPSLFIRGFGQRGKDDG
jgi:hypothetical protein